MNWAGFLTTFFVTLALFAALGGLLYLGRRPGRDWHVPKDDDDKRGYDVPF